MHIPRSAGQGRAKSGGEALRFATFGAGFWTRFQLSAWRELGGARCVAIYNRTRAKAEVLAAEFGIERAYDDPAMLLGNEDLDFVDIVTAPDTHLSLIRLVADRHIPVICQKPLATSFADAEAAVRYCAGLNVPLLVHDNFRWQTPIRALKAVLISGVVGTPFRARVEFSSSFPVFENQPFLRELDQFILADVGSHLFDVTRFLLGEARSVSCRTNRVHPEIRGEDVATALVEMRSGATAVCEMSFASRLPTDSFPQTLVRVEGSKGTAELLPGFILRVTTAEGISSREVSPPYYSWADPAYGVVHSSIVPCHENLLGALRGIGQAETTGRDNLESMRLVFSAYESNAKRVTIPLDAE